jgi:hypothetical protein
MPYRVTLDPNDSNPLKSLTYRAAEVAVAAEISAGGIDRSNGWSVWLDLKFRNDGLHRVSFDWRGTNLSFGRSPNLWATEAYTSGGWTDTKHPITLPPGKETKVRISFWGWEDFLHEYSTSRYLVYQLGFLITADSSALCELPAVYAFPEHQSMWMNLHLNQGLVGYNVLSAAHILESSSFPVHYKVTSAGAPSKRRKSLRERCSGGDLSVKVKARGWDQYDFWGVAVDLEFRNESSDSLLYEWQEGHLTFADSITFDALLPLVNREYFVTEEPVKLAPDSKTVVSFYFKGSENLREFLNSKMLLYRLGSVSSAEGRVLCQLPDVHAYPAYESEWTFLRERRGIP